MNYVSLLLFILVSFSLSAKEYHVAKNGNNNNQGSLSSPMLAIQAAAELAQPGDEIIVHEGVYRERITPPRGGTSNDKRIVYRAAPGETAEIKGSEIIKEWKNFSGNVWKAVIPNTFFGDYNPYKDVIRGDWFYGLGRVHHTGDVYLNGKSMWEMPLLENVLDPKRQEDKFDPEGSTYTWFCESDETNTYLYANFQGADPNKELVEINVRKSCFYPEKTNINYITIDGFIMRHAATQWAPPTAEQIGLIGTHWSKGWIIENNTISDSRCSGVTLGKHGDEYDNTSEDSAEGYVETIHRALARGWSKENIGSHIVRNNTIYNCEQTGICGSMGGIFSTIENNNIYNIWTKQQFTGAEMGGIKIHAAIDMLVKNNRLANCGRGLWLDWMAQGAHVVGNLLYNNVTDDLFMEVNHGPFLIENNILLSDLAIKDWSEGGAYVHNLIGGNIELKPQDRLTPYHPPHSTEVAGLKQTKGGDNRFYNNVFIGGVKEEHGRITGLGVYKNTVLPMHVNGNVYLNNANVYINEENNLTLNYNPNIRLNEKNGDVVLSMEVDKNILKMKNPLITTDLLGKAMVPAQQFTYPDGSKIEVTNDYIGNQRNKKNPAPGPFENLKSGENSIQIWSDQSK